MIFFFKFVLDPAFWLSQITLIKVNMCDSVSANYLRNERCKLLLIPAFFYTTRHEKSCMYH